LLKIRKRLFVLSLLFLIMLIFVIMDNVQVKAEESNPYVKVYLDSEKNINAKSVNLEDDDLVEPEVENKIIIDTLKDYYNMDLLLLDELKSYSISTTLEENIISTKREDKESAMHELIELYYDISDTNHKDIIIDFIDRYVRSDDGVDEKSQDFLDKINNQNPNNIEPFSVNDIYEDNLKSLNSNDTTAEEMKSKIDGISTFAISMNNAGVWAYNNYNKYSKNYPKFTGDFGTDCTNFVSQAMHVGGKVPYQGNWKISKLNNKYWVINSSSQLNASWKLTNPSPWISVKEFSKYWMKKSVRTYSYSNARYSTDHEKIYNNKIYKGSVVIFSKGVAGFVGIPTHAMIVSSYDAGKKDFLLAGHSVERKAHPLTSAVKKYSMIDILVIK